MNEAIGWALFHFLWEGAAIALVLATFLLVCRSARGRYAAACVALLAMLAAFAITLGLKVPKLDATTVATVHVPAAMLAARPAQTPDLPANPRAPLMYRWAVRGWLLGVALLLLHRLAGFAATHRLRRTGVQLATEAWRKRTRELAASLGIRRGVELLESCLTEIPVTAGFLRPAILLPFGMFAGLPAEQVEYILIHELAHIGRCDYLVNAMQSLVEVLLFYHPAVWWVSGVIRAEREHCCDEAVVALAGNAHAYAAALVKLEHSRVPEPALAATGGNLAHRVRRLLYESAPQSLAAPLAAAGLALAIVGVTLAAANPQQIAPPSVTLPHPAAPVLVAQAQTTDAPQRPVLKKDSAAEPETANGELTTPYRKWLNEDVAYIITDEERRAYKSLQTDPEREQFIEQFWQRRDPTPGTPENEFKEEHYRRIAYANEHFSSQIPGWKTDRGRVYITYGPPDEIEDHSNPASGTAPFQQWRYRYIEGVGQNVIVEFIDPNRNGEYRMTSDPMEKADALRLQNASQRLEQFAKLQKPAASVPAANASVFVSNEPGGRVSVHVMTASSAPAPAGRGGRGGSATARSVSVSLPFSAPARYHVQGVVKLADGRTAAAFEDDFKVTDYHATLRLEPGSYVLEITYKNMDTGDVRQETANFYVN